MKKVLPWMLLMIGVGGLAFAAETVSPSYFESAAGSLPVAKQKVGVLIVDSQSYTWPTTLGNPTVVGTGRVVPIGPDSIYSIGLKAEIINRGGQVMVMNPPGTEKLISPFVVMKTGQIDAQEELAQKMIGSQGNNALISVNSGNSGGPAAAPAAATQSLAFIQSIMNTSEFASEVVRVEQYSEFFTKAMKLWGITKLITLEQPNATTIIVRGYDVSDANVSAALTFQYYFKADSGTSLLAGLKYPVSGAVDVKEYRVSEDSKAKPEDSNLVKYSIIKRIGEYFK